MILNGRHQRLNNEHIGFATIGLELRLQTIIAEPCDLCPAQWLAQPRANLCCQFSMSATAEDDDFSHYLSTAVWATRALMCGQVQEWQISAERGTFSSMAH